MWERHDDDLKAAEAGDTRRVWHSEICEICGEYIREGDEIVDSSLGYYHLECLEDKGIRFVITELADAVIKEAQSE